MKDILKHWIEGKVFENIEDIPPIPKVDENDYNDIIIPNIIRRGGIPKDFLVVGEEYWGSCRNSDIAKWTGEKFVYQRCKFGYRYEDEVNHFQDDDGYDLFLPIKLNRDPKTLIPEFPTLAGELGKINYWSIEVNHTTGSLILGLKEDLVVAIEKPKEDNGMIRFTFYNRSGLTLGGGNLRIPDAVEFINKQKGIRKPSKSYI
jgi:hypothetical protein